MSQSVPGAIPVLSTTRYVKPGTYLGRILRANPVGQTYVRTPCYVAKGARLKTLYNTAIIRSYITGKDLDFSVTAPNIAPLLSPANPDKTVARLVDATGNVVPASKWKFVQSNPLVASNPFDEVLITPEAFNPSTTYTIDYQSTDRSVTDPMNISDLRLLRAVGDAEGQAQYDENIDYRIMGLLTGEANFPDQIKADSGNLHYVSSSAVSPLDATSLTAPIQISGVGGSVVIKSGAAYTHMYSRQYTIKVAAIGINVVFEWESVAISGGNDALPNVPIDPNVVLGDDPTYVAATFSLAANLAGQNQDLIHPLLTENGTSDLGVSLTLDTNGAAVGDTWTFYALGPGIIEFDSRYPQFNDNQFADISAVTRDAAISPFNVDPCLISVTDSSLYTGTMNLKYVLTVVSKTPGVSAVMAWQGYGELDNRTGTRLTVPLGPLGNRKITLDQGIILDFGDQVNAGKLQVGESYRITARAPRLAITAKDNRNYAITTTAASYGSETAVQPTPGVAAEFLYVGDTLEAGFDQVLVLRRNALSYSWSLAGVSYKRAPLGNITIPGDFKLWVRNIGNAEATTVPTVNRLCASGCTGKPDPTVADKFSFSYADELLFDWNLKREETQNFGSKDILLDSLGIITGTAGKYYIILSHTPSLNDAGSPEILYVHQGGLTGAAVPFTPILNTLGLPTPYVMLPTMTKAGKASASLQIKYRWRGFEPNPGATYYFTSDILRPASDYNTPIVYTTIDAARRALGPSETTNDALIMAEIAFANGPPQIEVIQVKDSSGTGEFSDFDYQLAVAATEKDTLLTDVVVVNRFGALSTAIASNVKMNDPFMNAERMLWVGAPANTPIGDTQNPGSLVYLAKTTLQVFGDSQAHGRRVLLSPTYATRTILTAEGSQIRVALEGSFVAGAAAAKNASYTRPSQAILYDTLAGFDFIQTYQNDEELKLGAASILILHDIGSPNAPVYRFDESVTVDQFSSDNNEISAQNQQFFVVRDIRQTINLALIGFTPDSEQAGIAIIQSLLVQKLAEYVSRGFIAPYTDSSGRSRQISPSDDVAVFRSDSDKTLYNVSFWFNLLYTIKRVTGLYSVDKKLFGIAALVLKI
jgi:hypothetical protein